MLDTTCTLERKRDLTFSIQDQPTLEDWTKRIQARPTQAWHKKALDALSPLVSPASRQTLAGHRLRGEDTLNWGDPGKWAEILLLQCWTEAPGSCFEQYGILRDIVLNQHLQELEKMYHLRDATAVRCFLQIHPHLINVLMEARPRVVERFGSDVQLALELVRDPEVENWDELFAYIITPLPVDQALACLDKLDKEWFLDQVDRVGDLFNLNLECV